MFNSIGSLDGPASLSGSLLGGFRMTEAGRRGGGILCEPPWELGVTEDRTTCALVGPLVPEALGDQNVRDGVPD